MAFFMHKCTFISNHNKCLTVFVFAYYNRNMNNLHQSESLIDMWFPTRIDTENCPMDWFNIKYVYGLEPDKMPPPNAKMRSGSAVESCLVDIIKGKAEKEAREHWQNVLEQHHPINEKDVHQKNVCIGQFQDVVTNLLAACRELQFDPTDFQELVKGDAKGIDLAMGGYVDITTKKSIIEIKTQWSTASGLFNKDGSLRLRKPSKLETPQKSHLRQVATYSNAAQKPPILIVANAFEYTIFDELNTEFMRRKELKHAFETMRLSARARQNLLKISNDPRVFALYAPLNLLHFVWKDFDEEVLKEIMDIWGVET